MRKILITGAAGFVGRHLRTTLKGGNATCLVDTVLGDSFDSFLRSHTAHKEFDVAVHLAANILNVDARMRLGVGMFEDTVLDYHFCRWAQENRPKHIVLMSSCAIDGATDPYSQVKRNLESMSQALVRREMSVTVLRPFSGYGGDQSLEYPFPAILARALRQENPLIVWGGHQVRDWLYIDDLVAAIIHAIDGKFPTDGTPVEIGTGIGTNFFRLAEEIAASVGYHPHVHGDQTKEQSSDFRVAATHAAAAYGWTAKMLLKDGIINSIRVMQETDAWKK